MKKITKKLLALLLASVMTLGSLPIIGMTDASAATSLKVGDIIEIKFGERWVKFEVLNLTQSIKKEDAENMVKLIEE